MRPAPGGIPASSSTSPPLRKGRSGQMLLPNDNMPNIDKLCISIRHTRWNLSGRGSRLRRRKFTLNHPLTPEDGNRRYLIVWSDIELILGATGPYFRTKAGNGCPVYSVAVALTAPAIGLGRRDRTLFKPAAPGKGFTCVTSASYRDFVAVALQRQRLNEGRTALCSPAAPSSVRRLLRCTQIKQ